MATDSSARSRHSARRNRSGIVPIRLTTTSGTWYTLWAPEWTAHGERWQAFLGAEDRVTVLDSPAELIAWVESTAAHGNDLSDHPQWARFRESAAARIATAGFLDADLIEVPHHLAKPPVHSGTRAIGNSFDVLRALGQVAGIDSVNRWFGDYSLLQTIDRGPDHFASQNGAEEWTSIGRLVVANWVTLLDDVDAVLAHPDVDSDATSRAEAALKEAESASDASEADTAASAASAAPGSTPADTAGDAAEPATAADPYDATLWAAAGIDPIRITLSGRSVYTLRCYVDGRPVFLGHMGLINTFPNSRALVRWMIDAKEHDMVELETWPDLVLAANGGELDVKVHPTNDYVFTGISDDIATGIPAVDTEQLGRAYELLADAADWAGDDKVNQVLVAYPRLQNYIAYVLGSPSETTPSAPFDEEVRAWKLLEEQLAKRLTKH